MTRIYLAGCVGLAGFAGPAWAQSILAEGAVSIDGTAATGELLDDVSEGDPTVFAVSDVDLGIDDFSNFGAGRLSVRGGAGLLGDRASFEVGDASAAGVLQVQDFGSRVQAETIAINNGQVLIAEGGTLSTRSLTSGTAFGSEPGGSQLDATGFGSAVQVSDTVTVNRGLVQVRNGAVLTASDLILGSSFESARVEVTDGGRIDLQRLSFDSANSNGARPRSVLSIGVGSQVRVEGTGFNGGFVVREHTIALDGGTLQLGDFNEVEIDEGGEISGHGNLNGRVRIFDGGSGPTGRLAVAAGETLNIRSASGGIVLENSGGRIENEGTLDLGPHDFINDFEGSYLGRNGTLRAVRLDNFGGTIDLIEGLNLIDAEVNNVGFDSVGDSRISLSGGATAVFTQDVVNNATIRVEAGSTLRPFLGAVSGTGVYSGQGDTVFFGELSLGNSPGFASFAGDVFFENTLESTIELGGTTRATLEGPNDQVYDAFDVNGTLNLGGDLNITLVDGFVPQLGDSFDLFNAATVNGTVNSVATPSLSAGLFFDLTELNTTGVITVVPEPATAAVLGLLAGAGLLRRRRA